jgi:hypothetical protein
MISSNYYEVLEIHTMQRGIICLVLRTIKGTSAYVNNLKGSLSFPAGSLTITIGLTENKPRYANFYPSTKSLNTIHNRIDFIKETIKHHKLTIIINGVEIPPYSIGTRYKELGLYVGTKEDDKGEYYCFMEGIKEVKRYL